MERAKRTGSGMCQRYQEMNPENSGPPGRGSPKKGESNFSRGALSVLAVLGFLGSWNDYLWPLIVLRSADKFTYPVGLATLVGLYKVEYGMILAGAFLATLPIVAIFIAGRNYLLANVLAGALKG